MKTIFLSAVIILGGATCSLAKIGETMAECDARYGKPVEQIDTRRNYALGTFEIACWFKDGACEAVSYLIWNKSLTAESPSDPLSEVHAMRLLAINGRKWKQIEKSDYEAAHCGAWLMDDLIARVSSSGVVVESGAMMRSGLAALVEKEIGVAISKMEEGKPAAKKSAAKE